MYLIPIIKINRAIACSLIFPEHTIQTIAISEFLSLFLPLFNPHYYSKTIAHIICFIYNPIFAPYILKNYEKADIIYKEAEICLILLFNLFFFLIGLDI